MPAATCRRRTLLTSKSSSSGAVRSWPRSAALASWPSAESSASAGARTLASTTITVLPDQCRGGDQRDPATPVSTSPVQHLVNRRDGRLVDQTRQQVLLQGLMSSSRPSAKHRVRVIRHVFDLHARHGAILAPELAFAQGMAHAKNDRGSRRAARRACRSPGSDQTGRQTGCCLPGTPALKRVMNSGDGQRRPAGPRRARDRSTSPRASPRAGKSRS